LAHVPAEQVSVLPTTGEPVMTGSTVLLGAAGAAVTVTDELVADEEPDPFVAVTTQVTVPRAVVP
jgi:hypothetical protein